MSSSITRFFATSPLAGKRDGRCPRPGAGAIARFGFFVAVLRAIACTAVGAKESSTSVTRPMIKTLLGYGGTSVRFGIRHALSAPQF
jgi:hypothetical protein